MQRLCSEEDLAPENTVFVSGIGCSSRLPHYMKTYGFHGLHGRALPVACGVKSRRPDLDIWVATGDGDCCSIGTAHWVHATRYNMNMTVMLHDNQIYGLTKNQASPTSPIGTRSNTTPRGALLEPFDPLHGDTRRVQRVVRRPGTGLDTGSALPDHPRRLQAPGLLVYPHSAALSRVSGQPVGTVYSEPGQPADADARERHPAQPALSSAYKNQQASTIRRHRRRARSPRSSEPIAGWHPLRNPDVPCYEDMRKPDQLYTPELIKQGLDEELDKFTIWPRD